MIGTSTMEEWLRQQAESVNAKKVTTRTGIRSNSVLFFSTWRTTHSDIISVVNTSRLYSSSNKSPRNKERRRIKSVIKKQSPLQSSNAFQEKIWKKQNYMLRKEEQIFMSNLDTKRFEREDLELGAATSIQKCTRAYLLRRWFSKEKNRLKAKAKLKSSYQSVTRQLMLKKQMEVNLRRAEYRKRVGAIAIQGQFRQFLARRAVENERERRVEENESRAAKLIQGLYRGKLARSALKMARSQNYEISQHLAASLLQRIFRGFSGRRRAICRRYLLEIMCATMIQRHYRRRLAFKFMKKERTIREVQLLNDNATRVQAIMRGNNDRKLVRFFSLSFLKGCFLRFLSLFSLSLPRCISLPLIPLFFLTLLQVRAMRRHEILLLRHASALNIQRAYRGHLGRYYASVMRRRFELEREYRATLTLQRSIRGWLGRNVAKQKLYDIQDDLFAQIRLGRIEQVTTLLGGDTLCDYAISTHDEAGNGVVHKAAIWGHLKLIKKLCKMGANPNVKNHKNETSVQVAVKRGWERVAEYLLDDQKCDIEFTGRTLLHDAAFYGMYGVVLALIYRGIKTEEKDDANDRTSLIEAVRGGHAAITKLLLEHGADPNTKDDAGRTALHYAATQGDENIVRVLVNAGGRFDVKDSEGNTAWRLALSSTKTKVQHYFLKCWRKDATKSGSKSLKKNKSNRSTFNNTKKLPEEAKLAAVAAARRGDLETVRR